MIRSVSATAVLTRGFSRVRTNLGPVCLAAAAAAIAWLVAHRVLGHPQPFFAPIAATIALSTSRIQRSRRIVQMVGGVLLGIGIEELVLGLLGAGVITLLAIVFVTLCAALPGGEGVFGEGHDVRQSGGRFGDPRGHPAPDRDWARACDRRDRRRLRGARAWRAAVSRPLDLLGAAMLATARAAVSKVGENQLSSQPFANGIAAMASALDQLAQAPYPWPTELREALRADVDQILGDLVAEEARRIPAFAAAVRTVAIDLRRLIDVAPEPEAQPFLHRGGARL